MSADSPFTPASPSSPDSRHPAGGGGCQIRFRKPRAPVSVAPGANLMHALLEAGLPVASSCGGDGVCTKCVIQIIEGAENLSPQNDAEEFLRERHDLAADLRVSCQTEVLGDIVVDASYW